MFKCVFQMLIATPFFVFFFFFFNDTATTEIYTLSLHDALPICRLPGRGVCGREASMTRTQQRWKADRKSTRLNSSHLGISYAVFCLKKKKKKTSTHTTRTNSSKSKGTRWDRSYAGSRSWSLSTA